MCSRLQPRWHRKCSKCPALGRCGGTQHSSMRTNGMVHRAEGRSKLNGTLPLPWVSTAFVAKTLPLPCVSAHQVLGLRGRPGSLHVRLHPRVRQVDDLVVHPLPGRARSRFRAAAARGWPGPSDGDTGEADIDARMYGRRGGARSFADDSFGNVQPLKMPLLILISTPRVKKGGAGSGYVLGHNCSHRKVLASKGRGANQQLEHQDADRPPVHLLGQGAPACPQQMDHTQGLPATRLAAAPVLPSASTARCALLPDPPCFSRAADAGLATKFRRWSSSKWSTSGLGQAGGGFTSFRYPTALFSWTISGAR